MGERQRWVIVVAFAAAMAWVEAAVVVYLRTLIGRVQPYQPDPLPVVGALGQTELVREAATLLMLLCVGWLAGRRKSSRWGYALLAFGVWDILYYAFLKAISGWPTSLLDWDVLFLLPLPWWGPVLAPISIAALMILGGSLVTQFGRPDRDIWPRAVSWGLGLVGAALALVGVFMVDSLHAAPGGEGAIRAALPMTFNWLLFAVALALMAAPVVDVFRQALVGPRARSRPPRRPDGSGVDRGPVRQPNPTEARVFPGERWIWRHQR